MSGEDYGENTTVYDYSSYYAESDEFTVCNLGNVSTFAKVFLPTLYSLVFILGFLGNGLVVCVLVKHRNKANLTDICLLNLAISDLLFVFTLPFYATFVQASRWIFGEFLCSFLATSHTVGFFSSILFMVVVSLDRYMSILHTFKTAKYRTLKTGIAVSIVVWILSLGVSLPAFFFTKLNNASSELSCGPIRESHAWVYNILVSNVLGLLIPMLVMVACYSRIIPTLMKIKTERKHRVVKVIMFIVVAFFVFWAPYNISLLLYFLKESNVISISCGLETNLKLALTVTEAFAYTHCCLNPIIYAFVSQRFMKRSAQLLKSWTHFPPKDFTDSSYRRGSVMSKSSETTPIFII